MCLSLKKTDKEKVIILFHGGLGNQLYQYCFYRWIQICFPDIEVLADLSEYVVLDCHQGFELFRVFPKIQIQKASGCDLYKVYGELPRIYGWVGKNFIERKVRKPLNKWIFSIKSDAVFEECSETNYESVIVGIKNGKRYFSGYWQDNFYFSENIRLLRQELKFKDITDEENILQFKRIQDSDSVSVHVRRGDYVSAGWPLLEMEYYKQAVKIISEKVENPLFFIFSDDKEYIEHEFEWLENKVIVKNNNGQNSYIDLQLMSHCKHNIVANSTFSMVVSSNL